MGRVFLGEKVHKYTNAAAAVLPLNAVGSAPWLRICARRHIYRFPTYPTSIHLPRRYWRLLTSAPHIWVKKNKLNLEAFAKFWDHDVTVKAGSDESRKMSSNLRAAMNDRHILRTAGRLAEPAEKLILVGVPGKAMNLFDLDRYGTKAPVKSHLTRTIQYLSTERTRGQISNEQQSAQFIVEITREMMLDAAACAHARAGDDDRRATKIVDLY